MIEEILSPEKVALDVCGDGKIDDGFRIISIGNSEIKICPVQEMETIMAILKRHEDPDGDKEKEDGSLAWLRELVAHIRKTFETQSQEVPEIAMNMASRYYDVIDTFNAGLKKSTREMLVSHFGTGSIPEELNEATAPPS